MQVAGSPAADVPVAAVSKGDKHRAIGWCTLKEKKDCKAMLIVEQLAVNLWCRGQGVAIIDAGASATSTARGSCSLCMNVQ